MKDADQAIDLLEDITLIPGPTEELLNERQFLDYRSEREQCLDWLLTFGIDPKTADGYAKQPSAIARSEWTSSTAGSGSRKAGTLRASLTTTLTITCAT